MRTALIAAALIATTLPTHAQTTTKEFLKKYGGADDAYLRPYLKGLGDGMSVYNIYKEVEGGGALYCPPGKTGLLDTQYAVIIRNFVAKTPRYEDKPIEFTLLFALKDAFPCKKPAG
jgi:hypothetical protein